MPAYVINDMVVTDPELFERYKQLSPPTVAQYGGRFLARGGQVENLEGIDLRADRGRGRGARLRGLDAHRKYATCAVLDAGRCAHAIGHLSVNAAHGRSSGQRIPSPCALTRRVVAGR